MSKPKFDLSNVGGQPKDWAQRRHENDLKARLVAKDWGLFLLIGVLALGLLACISYLALRVLS